ncbi:MAG: metallopeptidase family protein [Chloroflexaceae bacterium]|nr:metallopeptidase family protein [Chloroflexaceae bacterium]
MPDSAAFEKLVAEVLDDLPPRFAAYLQNVEVIVEPRITRETCQRCGLRPGEVVYGLYEGVPMTRRGSGHAPLPATITIFYEPLERHCASRAELRREVRRTVLHELAHHFGISDERLEELGAY